MAFRWAGSFVRAAPSAPRWPSGQVMCAHGLAAVLRRHSTLRLVTGEQPTAWAALRCRLRGTRSVAVLATLIDLFDRLPRQGRG